MTITVNSLGANSADFVYTTGETPTTLIASIGTWLTSHGWTSHDASYNVYKALCFDGVTYKYVQLFSNNTSTLFIRVFETWNATTHVGTNECIYMTTTGAPTTYNGVTSNVAPFSTGGGYITMLVTNRYMLMYTKDVSNIHTSTPHGCVEWSTDYIDTTGAPFGWLWAGSMLGNYIVITGATILGKYYNMISPVRSFNNTAGAASRITAIQAYNYGCTMFSIAQNCTGLIGVGIGPQLPTVNDTTSNLPQCYTVDVVKHTDNTSTNTIIIAGSSTTIYYTCMQQTLGRLYGIKLVAGLVQSWLAGDTCVVSVDSNGFQVESGGTSTNHHTIPCYGGLTSVRFAVPV